MRIWSISDLKWCIHLSKSLYAFQLLGECHCWWTKEYPRAHVAKFYGRLRLIRSVLRASIFFFFKLIEIVILWVFLHNPFWLKLISTLLGITLQLFVNVFLLLRITDEILVAEMFIWSILLIKSDLKWCIHLSKSLYVIQLLGERHCWWTREPPRAHVSKFYGWLRLIRSVLRASEFFVSKND